jgi:hypothetical protein
VKDVLSKQNAKQFDMQQEIAWAGAAKRRRFFTAADLTRW